MPNNNKLKLNEIKTKNKTKKQVKVKPTNIPLNIEREFHAQIRAYNNQFKEAIREVLFPLIANFSKLTRDEIFKRKAVVSLDSFASTLNSDNQVNKTKYLLDTYTILYLHDGIGEDINIAIEAIRQKFDFIAAAEQISQGMVSRVSRINENKTKKTIENAIGVDVGNIIASENLTSFVEMQTIQNAELIKSVPQGAIEDIRRIVLNGLSEGLRHEEITKQISGSSLNSTFNKMNNRIKTIARTEVAKLNSQITNKRLTNLGIKKAVWDATNDSRTRPCHAIRDGKEYDIAVGLYSSCDGNTIQPGQEINCRCVAVPIVE